MSLTKAGTIVRIDIRKGATLTRLEGIVVSVLCAVLLVVLLFAPK